MASAAGRRADNKSFGEIAIDRSASRKASSGVQVGLPQDSGQTRRLPRRRSNWTGRFFFWILLLSTLAGGVWLIRYEIQTSWLQARAFRQLTENLSYSVAAGRSEHLIFPQHGPSDLRAGYVQLPFMLERLQERGAVISRQSRFNSWLMQYSRLGLYPPYTEKDQVGLQVVDRRGELIYQMQNPQRVYSSFSEIPAVMVEALLFIENRGLLDEANPTLNPAVDWGRFAKALVVYLGEMLSVEMPAMGGSTLATQVEKFRHSASGITGSGREKLVQMISASSRAYLEDQNTLEYRRQLVRGYLNGVPLSAAPGAGEVLGIGDGMSVWFGVEFAELNRLLRDMAAPGERDAARRAVVFKEVLSLMIGHRRPSYYFFAGKEELATLTDSYLRLLAKAGVIDSGLSELAQSKPLRFRDFVKNPVELQVVNNKASNLIRNRLAPLFKTSVYNLDRMDLTVYATLDLDLQEAVNRHLLAIRKPAEAEKAGVTGRYLLAPAQASELDYSFTLFERTELGNLVRVQTDTTGLPFDINEGSKLELGSTAKLRTLASYLEIIAELYHELRGKRAEELIAGLSQRPDPLSRWVGGWLLENGQGSLQQVLDAAMQRNYSASPTERFFTGGGVHYFNNFRREDNGRVVTVAEALENSINLPFIRMMHDIVNYTRAQQWENYRQVLQDDSDPRRKEVLDRFIDRESRVFLSRFWQKYRDKSRAERTETLLAGLRPSPVRLAVVYRHLHPEADEAAFQAFLKEHLNGENVSSKRLRELYDRYDTGNYNLQDKGYLASVHPLELWLLDYLNKASAPTYEDAVVVSSEVRREVYGWLLKARSKNARDTRIRTVLEVEAFSDIHRRWKRLGYPFDHLVPSLATALGSSGDKPAALAELMGIIINKGQRLPTFRMTRLEFATSTPYETQVKQPLAIPEQVMVPEVAEVLKKALAGVVQSGTGRRLDKSFIDVRGDYLAIGGKTGTGDNRIFTSRGGVRVSSRATSRTATFVFYLGDRHFGTLTAFVTGNSAGGYSFTSALPLQVLKSMAPQLSFRLAEQQ